MTLYQKDKFFVSIMVFSILLISSIAAQDDAAFIKHTIDSSFAQVSGIALGDLDNDGHMDIVGSAIDNNEIAYWSNSGSYPSTWTKHTVDDTFEQALYVWVADLDGDGLKDILATATDKVAWWRNPGDHSAEWIKQEIRTGFDGAHGIYAGDMDGDGDLDVIASARGLNTIAWWENSGGTGQALSWDEHLIDENLGAPQTVCVADMDNDGDNDILAGSSAVDNMVVWYRNDGDPDDFPRFVIGDDVALAHWVNVHDIDNDGWLDVLAVSYINSELLWWRNPGTTQSTWTQQTISDTTKTALTIAAADFDNDGFEDVIGTTHATRKLSWWRNDGKTPIGWSEQIIDSKYGVSWPVFVGDLDNDHDIDIVTGSHNKNEVTVWENTLLELELCAELTLPSEHFYPGDTFKLDSMLANPSETTLSDVPVVILMAIYGEFWFWPSWSKFDPNTGQGFEFQLETISNGTTMTNIIPEFQWPETNNQTVIDVEFMIAMLTSDMSDIRGEMDTELIHF